jgi:hypothetical protein
MLLGALLVAAVPLRAEMVVEWWGGQSNCRHQRMKAEREGQQDCGFVQFDLSALKRGAKIYHASLRMHTDKPKLCVNSRAYMEGGYYDPLRLWAEVAPTRPVKIYVRHRGKAVGEPAQLEPPRFRSFDVTAAVRDWVDGKRPNEGFLVADFQHWVQWQSTLEIRYEGTPTDVPRQATNLKAFHRDGQTFLTWTEIDKLITEDPVRWKQFNEVFLANAPDRVDTWWKKPETGPRRTVLYRIYRSDRPITAENLAEAERIDEIYPLSGYDGRIHQHTCRGEDWTGLDPNVIVPRYVIDLAPAGTLTPNSKFEGCVGSRGEPQWLGRQLPVQTGLYVVQASKPGKAYYAVTVLENGVENTVAISSANSLAEPAAETVASGEPVLYRVLDQTHRDGRTVLPRETQYYVYWAAPPYDNRVRQPIHILVSFAEGNGTGLKVRHSFGDMYWSELVAGTHPYEWKRNLRVLTIEQSTPSWDSGRNSAAGTLMMAVPKESVPYEKNLEELLRPWVLKLSPRMERERKGK